MATEEQKWALYSRLFPDRSGQEYEEQQVCFKCGAVALYKFGMRGACSAHKVDLSKYSSAYQEKRLARSLHVTDRFHASDKRLQNLVQLAKLRDRGRP